MDRSNKLDSMYESIKIINKTIDEGKEGFVDKQKLKRIVKKLKTRKDKEIDNLGDF